MVVTTIIWWLPQSHGGYHDHMVVTMITWWLPQSCSGYHDYVIVIIIICLVTWGSHDLIWGFGLYDESHG